MLFRYKHGEEICQSQILRTDYRGRCSLALLQGPAMTWNATCFQLNCVTAQAFTRLVVFSKHTFLYKIREKVKAL